MLTNYTVFSLSVFREVSEQWEKMVAVEETGERNGLANLSKRNGKKLKEYVCFQGVVVVVLEFTWHYSNYYQMHAYKTTTTTTPHVHAVMNGICHVE